MKQGVYQIKNHIDERVYIGSSVNLPKRKGKRRGKLTQTHIENIKKSKRGERNPQSKLTYVSTQEIRAKYKPYKYTAKMLANEYNVSEQTIRDVVENRAWVSTKNEVCQSLQAA